MAMAKMTFEEFEAKKIRESPECDGLYSSSGYAKLEEAIRDMLDYPGYERLIGYILRVRGETIVQRLSPCPRCALPYRAFGIRPIDGQFRYAADMLPTYMPLHLRLTTSAHGAPEPHR
jgi:hypothetical protein